MTTVSQKLHDMAGLYHADLIGFYFDGEGSLERLTVLDVYAALALEKAYSQTCEPIQDFISALSCIDQVKARYAESPDRFIYDMLGINIADATSDRIEIPGYSMLLTTDSARFYRTLAQELFDAMLPFTDSQEEYGTNSPFSKAVEQVRAREAAACVVYTGNAYCPVI